MGTVGDSCAGKLGQSILRAMHAAVHELATIQPNGEFFASLVQPKNFIAAGNGRTVKQFPRNQKTPQPLRFRRTAFDHIPINMMDTDPIVKNRKGVEFCEHYQAVGFPGIMALLCRLT